MSELLTWEIINPSDHYTIQAPDFEVAAVATLLLGEGAYGLEPIDSDEPRLPIFLLGGFDEWWSEFRTDGKHLGDVIVERRPEIATALDSVLIGNRSLFEKANMDRDVWHEEHRSSMNDIGSWAWKMANQLRETSEVPG